MKFKFYLWSLLTLMAVSMTAVGCSDDDDVVAPTPDPEIPPVEEKMTFDLTVSGVTADAAAFKAVPSDLSKTYYVDVVDAASFAGLTEDKMIEMILQNSDAEDLVSGVFEASAEDTMGAFEPETDYIFFALGYNEGKVVSELFTKSFTTLKAEEKPQPETKMTFELQVSNVTANGATLNVTPSDMRTYAANFIPASMFDQGTPEQAIEMVLKMVKPEDLEQGQLELTAEGLNPETEYVFFALGIKDGVAISDLAYERFTTLKAETEPQPEVGAPKLTITGEYVKAENILSFLAQCTSKNAEEASYIITTKQMIDQLQNDGMDLDSFLASQGDKFSSSMLSKMNAEGARLTFGKNPDDGFETTMPWSLLISAKNAEGKTLERCDVDPAEADFDLTTKMHAILTPGDKDGLNPDSSLMVHFSSDVNNLSRGYIALFVTSELENSLNAGQALDQLILAQENNVLAGAVVDMLNNGNQMHLNFSGLASSTSYTFTWLAYDKKEHVGILISDPLVTSAPGEAEPEGPFISNFEVSPTNVLGFGMDHSASCLLKSETAVSGKVCCIETDRYFELAKTLSPKEIVLQEGRDFTARDMKFINANKGLDLVGNFSDLKANTAYRYGVVLFNAEGNASVRWGDLKTAPAVPHGNDAGCPSVTAEGWAGNADKKFTENNYSFRLQGADVTGGVALLFDGSLIHQLFDAGSDAREIIDLMSSMNPEYCNFFSEEDCAAIRTPEGAVFTQGAQPNTLYTPIWRCHNKAGKAACGFIDIKTAGQGGVTPDPENPDPENPDQPQNPGVEANVTLQLSITPGDWNGEGVEQFILPAIKCTTQNAVRVSYLLIPKADVDAELNAGKSLVEIVMNHPKAETKDKAYFLQEVNSYGANPGYWKQKMGWEYSFVAIAWNAAGEYGKARIDWEFAGADTQAYPETKTIMLQANKLTAAKFFELSMANFRQHASEASEISFEDYAIDMMVSVAEIVNFDQISFALHRTEINYQPKQAVELPARAFNAVGLKRLAQRF